MPVLTIFTPVYNRAYTIGNLYRSLCRQSCREFEWVVVDDGSTDNIDELMDAFMSENEITIRYFKQRNGGKHRAINHGLRQAAGELFFIVDSDDFLTDDAVESIIGQYPRIKNDASVAGIGFMRCHPDGRKIGSALAFDMLVCTALDLRFRRNATGDMAELYKTEILRRYPFPEFENERFCPEALVWYRIADSYDMLWVNKCIYVCEYLADGLTNGIVRVRHQSPAASLLYYSELAHRRGLPFGQKIKAMINFWRFSFSSRRAFMNKCYQIGALALPLLPLGFAFYLKDTK